MPRFESPAIDAVVARVRATLSDSHPQIAEIFEGCFRNSLDTSVTLEPDGTTFVATGDIPAMWLRDSAAQVRPYVSLAAEDEAIHAMVKGLIQRTARYVNLDPYANAFNAAPNGNGHQSDRHRDDAVDVGTEVGARLPLLPGAPPPRLVGGDAGRIGLRRWSSSDAARDRRHDAHRAAACRTLGVSVLADRACLSARQPRRWRPRHARRRHGHGVGRISAERRRVHVPLPRAVKHVRRLDPARPCGVRPRSLR